LAIITMQTMTKINWAQRDAVAVDAAAGAVLTTVIFPSPDSRMFSSAGANKPTRRAQGASNEICPLAKITIL
jgi:hypothetical protein